jgi:hypothetical protein
MINKAELQRLRNIEAEARHLCENADFFQCDGLEGIFNVTVSDMNALKDALSDKKSQK